MAELITAIVTALGVIGGAIAWLNSRSEQRSLRARIKRDQELAKEASGAAMDNLQELLAFETEVLLRRERVKEAEKRPWSETPTGVGLVLAGGVSSLLGCGVLLAASVRKIITQVTTGEQTLDEALAGAVIVLMSAGLVFVISGVVSLLIGHWWSRRKHTPAPPPA